MILLYIAHIELWTKHSEWMQNVYGHDSEFGCPGQFLWTEGYIFDDNEHNPESIGEYGCGDSGHRDGDGQSSEITE